MFRDANDWPPGPDRRAEPPRRPTDAERRRERHAMIACAMLLAALLVGPFAGSSLIGAGVALWRAATGG